MIIDFITIEQGEDSCYRSVCKMVITNLEQWIDFWQRHVECICLINEHYEEEFSTKPCIPEIDFDLYNVIAVVAGIKPSTRYLTEILSVKTSSSQSEDRPLLSIDFRCQIPQGNSLVGHVSTCPYHLIKISKIAPHEFIFKETIERNYKM